MLVLRILLGVKIDVLRSALIITFFTLFYHPAIVSLGTQLKGSMKLMKSRLSLLVSVFWYGATYFLSTVSMCNLLSGAYAFKVSSDCGSPGRIPFWRSPNLILTCLVNVMVLMSINSKLWTLSRSQIENTFQHSDNYLVWTYKPVIPRKDCWHWTPGRVNGTVAVTLLVHEI